MTFYNEFEPFAAAWLRNLSAAGHISGGTVDERSISDIQPTDLAGVKRVHFFAGIGGWDLALRLAGWPADREVWTGSCPCQPFSAAGKRKGTADARHLWPEFLRLIADRKPSVVFGEQVASKDGRAWLAGVRSDLEALGYAVGAADLCAAGVGAPHIRQRLYWVAYAKPQQEQQEQQEPSTHEGGRDADVLGRCGVVGRMADTERHTRGTGWPANESRKSDGAEITWPPNESGRHGVIGRPGHPLDPRLEGHAGHGGDRHQPGRNDAGAAGPVAAAGAACDGRMDNPAGPRCNPEGKGPEGEARDGTRLCRSESGCGSRGLEQRRTEPSGRSLAGGCGWDDSEWIPCRDGKARRIKSGLEPLAHGIPARVGRLRGYGNAIVPAVAAEFIGAFMDAEAVKGRGEG